MLKSLKSTLRAIAATIALTPLAIAAADLPERVADGVVLHCHEWPLAAITANLDRIAAAGYTAVQLSPVQRLRRTKPGETSPQEPTGPWWLLYQPVSMRTIGNYKVGTEEDFRQLNEQAAAHGIKILVDVVFNHVADSGTPVHADEDLDVELRNPDLYHHQGSIESYQYRWQVTQRNLGNLPDLNTQDQRVQDLQVAFLNRCVSLGADGFRFDAAKHIETSRGEDGAWAGDYWEDVLHRLDNRPALYLFGEVLQDQGDNMDVYLGYYDVSCHNYGGVLREAMLNRDVAPLQNHTTELAGIPRDGCLAYVENHDDYEHGKSSALSTWERKMANAFLIARAGLVPRVLDRPEDDLWEDPDIVAVNHLRNAAAGTEEFLRFPTNRIALVERGTEAMVIVNLGHDTALDIPTGLADGRYDNRATAPATLEVSAGRLRGRLPGGAVFAAFQSDEDAAVTHVRAHYDTGWGHDLYERGNHPPLSWSRGIKMRWSDGNVWTWDTRAIPAGADFEFKALVDDRRWEIIDGEPLKNHHAAGGSTTEITPAFPQ